MFGHGRYFLREYVFKGRKKWSEPIYEHIYLLKHFIYEQTYCSLLNINLLSTGLWYEKYDTYGKVCTDVSSEC